MIEDIRGCIDYDEVGAGPTVVLVPGSCSTGAAWRPVMAQWQNNFHVVTTSLLGYGGTQERRSVADTDIDHEAEILEAVIDRAGCPVHLVGHSFCGLSALTVALRGRRSTCWTGPPPTGSICPPDCSRRSIFRRWCFGARPAIRQPDTRTSCLASSYPTPRSPRSPARRTS